MNYLINIHTIHSPSILFCFSAIYKFHCSANLTTYYYTNLTMLTVCKRHLLSGSISVDYNYAFTYILYIYILQIMLFVWDHPAATSMQGFIYIYIYVYIYYIDTEHCKCCFVCLCRLHTDIVIGKYSRKGQILSNRRKHWEQTLD